MPINQDALLGWKSQPITQAYTKKDVMFYALSLGVCEDPLNLNDLKFTYEKDLNVFPTMPVVMGSPGPWFQNPDFGINGRMMVHAEQGLKLLKPMPVEGKIRAITECVNIIDKGEGKGAMVYMDRTIYDDATGEKLAIVTGMAFARADGGFGGKTGPIPTPQEIPTRDADLVVDMKTLPQAALFYRLNGDMNPLHSDPEFAQSAKFPRPILHGLATYGLAARCIISNYGEFNEINARFSAPTFPGETVTIEFWKDGNEITFRASVNERGAVVLNNGYAKLGKIGE